MAKATTPLLRLPRVKISSRRDWSFDPELSPLDLAVAPNGNIVVSSEHPFGLPDAVTSVREYGAADGQLIRVFPAGGSAEFTQTPRSACFGPDGILYCVARDEVMAFDFARGRCLRRRRAIPTAEQGKHWCFSARRVYRSWR